MSINSPSVRTAFQSWLEDQPEGVQKAHLYAFAGITDLQQAIPELKNQITDLQKASQSSSTSTTIVETVTVTPFPGLGTVNDQTGNTAYTTQTGDNGALLFLNDGSAVAVSLNSVVSAPYFIFASNAGAGTVTFTPTTGNVNGGASATLGTGYFALLVFDGTNWTMSATVMVPQTFAPVLHEWIKSYDASTGLFTATQPDFSDISGIAAIAQGGTGTATPSLVAGSGITISGSWPDQTVATSVASLGLVIGFVLLSGTTGTNVGPMIPAARAGSLTRVAVVTKASDGSTPFRFDIKQNGTSIFTGTLPTVAAGTSSGTVSVFTSLTTNPLSVAQDDVFRIDVIQGTSSWVVTVQAES